MARLEEILISAPRSLVPSQKCCTPCLTFCHTVVFFSPFFVSTAFSPITGVKAGSLISLAPNFVPVPDLPSFPPMASFFAERMLSSLACFVVVASRGRGFFASLVLKPGGGMTGPVPEVAVSVVIYLCETSTSKAGRPRSLIVVAPKGR